MSKQEDAQALVDALKKKQYAAFAANAPGDKLFHVQVGPFADIKEAEGDAGQAGERWLQSDIEEVEKAQRRHIPCQVEICHIQFQLNLCSFHGSPYM